MWIGSALDRKNAVRVLDIVVALGADVARQTASLRRALRSKPGELRGVMLAGGLSIAALFATTLGATMLTGALPGFLGPLTLGAAMPTALSLFVAGSLLIVLLLYLVVALRHALRRQPAEQP